MPYSAPTPIDFNAVRRTVVGVLMTATGLPQSQIMQAEPEAMNAPRPKAPYLTFALTIPSAREGIDWATPSADANSAVPGLYTYYGLRQMTLEFESFGRDKEEAYAILAALQAALDYEPCATLFQSQKLAIRNIGDVVDLSVTMATAFEGRAQLTVDVGALSQIDVDLGQIQFVPVSGQVAIDGTNGLNVGPVTITADG